jgi:uncharacterized protein YciI
MTFAVTRTRGPGWKRSQPMETQPDWEAHRAFMNGLVAEGYVTLGGPLPGTHDVLLIMNASTPDEIRTRLGDDPWAAQNILVVKSIQPWDVRLGSLRS